MSFLSGPECSTASNPLSQFTKHVQDDKSLQRDRLQGRGPGGIHEGFRSQQNGSAQDQMMQQFLQQDGQIPEESVHEPFAMDQIRRDLDGYRVRPPLSNGAEWASNFHSPEEMAYGHIPHAQKANGLSSQGLSPAEFQKYEMMQRNGAVKATSPPPQSQYSMNGIQRPMGMGYGMGMGMGMGMMGSMQRPLHMPSQTMGQVSQSKGKARLVELDDQEWEKQFKQMDHPDQTDLDAKERRAMEGELDQMDRTLNGMQDGEDLGVSSETWNDINTWDAFDGQFADPFRDPQLGNYTFEEDNPYTGTANPYEEGLKIIRGGGNLSLAALAFEAAVQKHPEHVDSWAQLGSAQAQNEKESPAIRALTQCLKLDESNLPALMGLAISYTNEGYDSTAYRTLERWLSTKYPQIVPASDLTAESEFGFTDRHLLHEKVTDLFIRAAQLSPGGEQMDPDVQVGLGVLFYGAEEYEKAVDCFEAALASTEEGSTNSSSQAHLLWNRLGATLANSGRSEEAIAAYEKALTLNPNFVRARYNLGVSCINMGVYDQAAQHLLGALSMHRVVELEGMERVKEVVGQDVQESEVERMVAMNQSTNLLETLRRVFQSMGRRDLANKVEVGMDVESFHGEFDF